MSNALRDQLLKAGLINEKQAKKAARDQQKEVKRQQGQGTPSPAEEEQARAARAQAEKAERDRRLNQERQAEAERKAIRAEIRQLVEAHRQPADDGEIIYNFMDGGKVKRLHLSGPTRDRLVKGLLAIVRLDQGYALVAAEIAERVRVRDAASVVLLNPAGAAPEAATEDDPYACYQVPDDLMW
jgi:uncharacterized protein YaiL (DUF2058 family)